MIRNFPACFSFLCPGAAAVILIRQEGRFRKYNINSSQVVADLLEKENFAKFA